jgi:hypothetical protein
VNVTRLAEAGTHAATSAKTQTKYL